MRRYLPSMLVVLISCSGCGAFYTSQKVINQLEVGMTKAKAVSILGEPQHSSAHDKTEYLFYTFSNGIIRKQYYVQIINGTVNSFGRLDDLKDSRPPTVRIEKEEHIRVENKPALYNELQKLNALKEQGMLTQQEFESKREEILKMY
ncbi:MAG: SHOCT domain-containing protein [Nitrospira sp.]|nr:SHOCT domain-containing protein [Nitrospira sp.]MCP9465417.1 SHOCT domain-containing protein [Nitrospira sp.]